MSKFGLSVLAAIIVGGVVWIESRHRVVLEPSPPAELAAPAAAAACPDKESEPYDANCLAFMGGNRLFGASSRANAAPSVITNATREAPATACPDNDNVPYSESCLRFLSGRYWRPNLAGSTLAPADAPK